MGPDGESLRDDEQQELMQLHLSEVPGLKGVVKIEVDKNTAHDKGAHGMHEAAGKESSPVRRVPVGRVPFRALLFEGHNRCVIRVDTIRSRVEDGVSGGVIGNRRSALRFGYVLRLGQRRRKRKTERERRHGRKQFLPIADSSGRNICSKNITNNEFTV